MIVSGSGLISYMYTGRIPAHNPWCVSYVNENSHFRHRSEMFRLSHQCHFGWNAHPLFISTNLCSGPRNVVNAHWLRIIVPNSHVHADLTFNDKLTNVDPKCTIIVSSKMIIIHLFGAICIYVFIWFSFYIILTSLNTMIMMTKPYVIKLFFHFRREGRKIPTVVTACVDEIEKRGKWHFVFLLFVYNDGLFM